MQRALARITGDTAKTTAAIQKHFDGMGDLGGAAFDRIAANSNKAGAAVEAAGRRINTAMGASRVQTSNLAAQINDIGVQLAGGTSPFLIAIQQGSQINQALGSAGARGAVSALAGAFTSLLNPVSLATIAIIGLGGTAIQYFTEMLSSGEMTNEQLKEQADLIDRVAKRWGDAVPALKEYADQLNRLSDEADLREATKIRIDDIFKEAKQQVTDLNIELVDLVSKLQLAGADPTEIVRVQKAFTALKEAIEGNKDSAKENQELLRALSTVYINTSIPAADEFAKKVYDVAEAFKQVAEQAAAAEEQTRKALEQAQLADFTKTLPGNLGQLSPLFSGGGQFLDPQQFQDFKANEAQFRDAGASLAAQMIKGFEGFITNAKWDVNAFRVGFGSDTVTRANGAIEKVTKDTVVTLDEAERDLARRIVEFQSGIQSAIGVDTWRSLNEAQKAALTSIAYNYGSLPKAIVDAIESGGGPDVVAQAIARLTANPARRAQEAQAYLGGGSIGPSTLPVKQDPWEGLRKSAQDYSDTLTQINQQQEQFGSIVGGAIGALANAFRDGKLEASELLSIVAQVAQQLLSMNGGLGGFGGSFLSSIIGGIFHGGGVAGGSSPKRRVPALAFAGAPRYHGGGVAGFKPGEVPAILQRGEIILPRGARASSGGSSVVINAPINAPGADAAKLEQVRKEVAQLGKDIPKMVDRRDKTRQTRNVRA